MKEVGLSIVYVVPHRALSLAAIKDVSYSLREGKEEGVEVEEKVLTAVREATWIQS